MTYPERLRLLARLLNASADVIEGGRENDPKVIAAVRRAEQALATSRRRLS